MLICIVFSAQVMASDADYGLSEPTVRTLGKQYSGALATALASRLKAAVAEGGLVGGIEVCNMEAQDITADLYKPKGLSVGRTALRVRNPVNLPDAWEQEQLQKFEQALGEGQAITTLEAAERFEDGASVTWRYMKAIPTGGLCLGCHGANIAPEVRAEIEQRYPQDQATNFALGSLRGAFTVEITEPKR
jgi:hypothetical protein